MQADLAAVPEPVGAPQPIAIANRLLGLLTGTVRAVGAWERALVSRPGTTRTEGVVLALASATDDGGTAAPDSVVDAGALGFGSAALTAFVPVEVSPDVGTGTCSYTGVESCLLPRLAEWIKANSAEIHPYGCDTGRPRLSTMYVDGGGTCIAWGDSPGALCRVLVGLYSGACDASKGWSPSTATWPRPEEPVTTVCELRHLGGAALTACETDLACSGCEAGWCVSQVRGLDGNTGSCTAPDRDLEAWRFPLGADVGHGLLRIECKAAP